MLHGMSGSLSIKEKNQDSVLSQIPILHHRQRAEEAQEGRVPGQQATKQEGQRYYGIILALREELRPSGAESAGTGETGLAQGGSKDLELTTKVPAPIPVLPGAHPHY